MLNFVSNKTPSAMGRPMDFDEFEPWRKRLAEAFEAKRHEIQITKFSEELGLHRDYIRRLITDGTASPDPNLFIRICDKLGVSSAYIISGDKPSSEKERIARKILEADDEKLRKIERAIDIFD